LDGLFSNIIQTKLSILILNILKPIVSLGRRTCIFVKYLEFINEMAIGKLHLENTELRIGHSRVPLKN
jgi:hypothetical protein